MNDSEFLGKFRSLLLEMLSREPVPAQAKPMEMFLGQVLDSASMQMLKNAGWNWGFQTFTTQTADIGEWLEAVESHDRNCRISLNSNWFTPRGELTPLGREGAEAILDYADRIYGIEIEGPRDGDACYRAMQAALGSESYLLSGYMQHGHFLDQYSRIHYLMSDKSPKIGEAITWHYDPAATYAPQVVENWGSIRTPGNRPRAGVRTGHLWLQCRGHKPQPGETWSAEHAKGGAESNVLTGLLQPGRGHMHYSLLLAEVADCNQVTWYTNGSSDHPGKNLCEYDIEVWADLLHVINRYLQRMVPDTAYDRDYVRRNLAVSRV